MFGAGALAQTTCPSYEQSGLKWDAANQQWLKPDPSICTATTSCIRWNLCNLGICAGPQLTPEAACLAFTAVYPAPGFLFIAMSGPQSCIVRRVETQGDINAEPYRLRPKLGEGIRSCAYGNYVIFFIAAAQKTTIVRILQGARNFPSIFGADDEQ